MFSSVQGDGEDDKKLPERKKREAEGITKDKDK